MPTTKLFTESPLIGTVAVIAPVLAYYANHKILLAISLVILLFLLYFYRYYEHTERYPDNIIICPADGTITNMLLDTQNNNIIISIFLSPMNIHTQVYPANAIVLSHEYDQTGKFDIVADAEKSKENEKVIHTFQMPNGCIIKVIQIAGFLPRVITYDKSINHQVAAGEYLGMIKFGSRVDLILPLETPDKDYTISQLLNDCGDKPELIKKLHLSPEIALNKPISIGNLIGTYK